MTSEQENLIRKWRARSKRSQIAHHDSAVWSQRFHYMLGVPLVISSSLAAALIFAKLPTGYEWLASFSSLVAVILASLQTFLSFSEKSTSHRNAAYKYRDLKEELELALLHPPEGELLKRFFDDAKDKRSHVSAVSPSVYSWSWVHAKNETKDDNDSNSIRSPKT